MLLPMLSIYQEYVRNHHYSLQVLTECKQAAAFASILKKLENKPACRGRSLETFLTYPMHQVSRFLVYFSLLLDSVVSFLGSSLYNNTTRTFSAHSARSRREEKLAERQAATRGFVETNARWGNNNTINIYVRFTSISKVSETENLRKNLAVERMIVEGCDILLDVNQVFVRQGTYRWAFTSCRSIYFVLGSLIQLPAEKTKSSKSKLNFKSEKESLRQCYLFSNHLIVATRY